MDAAFCLCIALGIGAACIGDKRSAGEWVSLGVCIDLAFHALLRPGEIFKMTAGRVKVPPKRRRKPNSIRLRSKGRQGGCFIPRPKNARSFAT